MRSLLCMVLVLINGSLSARLYSQEEIIAFNQSQKASPQKAFLNEYIEASSSEEFLTHLINKSADPLQIESKLFSLLNYVEYLPRSPKHTSLVMLLKDFQPKAMKLHEEGSLEVAVFNLQARAQGVENYWSFLEVKQSIADQLNSDVITVLNQVKKILAEKHQAKTLALKESLGMLTEETNLQLSNHLKSNIHHIHGIEKFVIEFAIKNKDLELIDILNIKLSKVDSEYLLRLVVDNLDNKYKIEKLIEHSQIGKASRFATTLLKPFANKNTQVQNYLFETLSNKKLASAAAFSLTELSNERGLQSLKYRFSSSQSSIEQNNILLALRLNGNTEAKIILNQLMEGK